MLAKFYDGGFICVWFPGVFVKINVLGFLKVKKENININLKVKKENININLKVTFILLNAILKDSMPDNPSYMCEGFWFLVFVSGSLSN